MLNLRVLGTLSLIVGIGCLGVDLVKANELTYDNLSESMIAQSSSSIVGRYANVCCGGKLLRIRDFQNNGNFRLYSSFLNNNGQAQSLNSIGQGSYQMNGNNVTITEAHNNGQVFNINCVLKGNIIECQSADGTEIWKKQ
ncbi:MAG: hypothetical protein AB4041_14765 [Microcystaceae cyanobacterium]